MKKDFVGLYDFSAEELGAMLDLAQSMKKNPQHYRQGLAGQTLAMIFTKNSTRTRISFQTGIYQLGGQGLFLGANDLQLSRGESIADTARVLSRYVDGIMIRAHSHQDVVDMAHYSSVPVINGLTDFNHPCQVMADIMTIKEKFGKTSGLKLCYLGDGNNMTVSLLYGCLQFGMDISVVGPARYQLPEDVKQDVLAFAQKHNKKSRIVFTTEVATGVQGADVVVTDTWVSMGQAGGEEKLAELFPYQVNAAVMKMAKPHAIFLHCLPAHREEEVTSEVMDGPQSVIFDEAENRLHVQKAIMYTLMKS